ETTDVAEDDPVPCRNSARRSGGLPFVLVDQTAEPIMAHDRAARPPQLAAGRRSRQPERLVRTRRVVVVDVLTKHLLEVPAPNDEQPVQALAPDRADPAFGVGV